MVNLQLVSESDHHLSFQYGYLNSLVPLCMGLALLSLFYMLDHLLPIWLALPGSSLLIGIGLIGLMWQSSFQVNLVNRKYRRVRGFLWATKEHNGTLEQLKGVYLDCKVKVNSNDQVVSSYWTVEVEFDDWSDPLILFEHPSQAMMRQEAIRLTKKLKTVLLDLSGDEILHLSWEDLEKADLKIKKMQETVRRA